MQRYRAFLQTFLSNLCRAVIFNERSHTAAPWDFRIYFLSSRLASPPSSCMMSYGMLTSSVCEFSSFIVVDLSICRFLPTYAGPFWCADELAEHTSVLWQALWVKEYTIPKLIRYQYIAVSCSIKVSGKFHRCLFTAQAAKIAKMQRGRCEPPACASSAQHPALDPWSSYLF